MIPARSRPRSAEGGAPAAPPRPMAPLPFLFPLPLLGSSVSRLLPRLFGLGPAAAMSTAKPLKSVDYEVFGRVQGVCFRMYTEGEAKKVGVVGWVKNTSQGTVKGQVQGPEDKVNSIFQGKRASFSSGTSSGSLFHF
ncbi:acylphosphatase-2 isoform X2 [Sminthopsis crassicaudata]|uniref:acylphosphatase-2 isoform X2 n=1 Tax=Sminthopsis crassicaudata TaxID=9301 RepID=UPI003D69C46E